MPIIMVDGECVECGCKMPNNYVATLHWSKEHREDVLLRAKLQATVKDYALKHPGEITLPCEKHHHLPCSECRVV